MIRKTIDVAFLKSKTNEFLHASADEMVGERVGMAALLESALFATNNYKGYQYLSSEFVTRSSGRVDFRKDYDASRRRYF
jgi:hypothetical protein